MNVNVSQSSLPASDYYYGNSRPVNSGGSTRSCPTGVLTNATAACCLQDTNFGSNVTNPFNIANFSSLQTSNPQLYAAMASVSFFTSTTISHAYAVAGIPPGEPHPAEADRSGAREQHGRQHQPPLQPRTGGQLQLTTTSTAASPTATSRPGTRTIPTARRRCGGSRTTSTPTA